MKKVLFLSMLVIFFSGCGLGFLFSGESTTFEGNYQLSSKGSIEKSISKLKKVLYANGWNISSQDSNIIFLEKKASVKKAELRGEEANSQIKATFTESGIDLQIIQSGNFKFGTEESTNKTFEKIKKQYGL